MKENFLVVPTLLQLFGNFLSHETLYHIYLKTNRYATNKIEVTYMGDGGVQIVAYTQGGEKWYAVIVEELKAFIACTLYSRRTKSLAFLHSYKRKNQVYNLLKCTKGTKIVPYLPNLEFRFFYKLITCLQIFVA